MESERKKETTSGSCISPHDMGLRSREDLPLLTTGPRLKYISALRKRLQVIPAFLQVDFFSLLEDLSLKEHLTC